MFMKCETVATLPVHNTTDITKYRRLLASGSFAFLLGLIFKTNKAQLEQTSFVFVSITFASVEYEWLTKTFRLVFKNLNVLVC